MNVNGNYGQTGWEYRIIDLRSTLVFPNQLQLLATYKLLVSLGLISQYKPFVLNLCTDYSKFMYSIYLLYTFYTACSGVSRTSLGG